MSGSWSGGKGDKSRVTNFNAYWNSALWQNKGPMRKALMLDDIREPMNAILWNEPRVRENGTKEFPLVVEVSGIPSGSWDVVRTYEEFCDYVDKHIPDVVSFDNDLVDLSDCELTTTEAVNLLQMNGWEYSPIKMGAHCAQYLVEKCKELKKPIPTYYIHTANRNAYYIIKGILEDAKL